MPLAAGSRLGHYEIVSAIGAGGMGEVYRSLEDLSTRVFASTEGPSIPFWSPDSRSVAFLIQGTLKRLDLSDVGLDDRLMAVPVHVSADGTRLACGRNP
jgi:hypothetical protein